jgi:carbonic anhydrase/acetyltransferase-like protein (isoleucine patch superfamily)
MTPAVDPSAWIAPSAQLFGEDDCLVGIGATIMDGAVIGRGSIVAGGAFVKEGTIVPPHSIVAGIPAKVIKARDCSHENRLNAWLYQRDADT